MGGWDPCAIDNGTGPGATLPGPLPLVLPGVNTVRRSSVLVAIAGIAVATALATSAAPVRAGVGVNLDQWASSDLAWQNGNLNGNNSRYPEGGIVPFRLAVEGLKAGAHSIHINYDFTAGGHKAYDFLATWNVTNAGRQDLRRRRAVRSRRCAHRCRRQTATRSRRTPSRPTACRSAAPRSIRPRHGA